MPYEQKTNQAVGVSFNIEGHEELLRDLRQAPEAVKGKVTIFIHGHGQKVWEKARLNLSGQVLQVQTGRLRGSWVQLAQPLYWEAQSDVFYGAIHEAGNYPWLQPAWDELGGEAAVLNGIREALDEGLREVGL